MHSIFNKNQNGLHYCANRGDILWLERNNLFTTFSICKNESRKYEIKILRCNDTLTEKTWINDETKSKLFQPFSKKKHSYLIFN